MVEQTQRFDPIHEVAHELLQRGDVGAVNQLRGRIGHAGPEYWAGESNTWFTHREQSGGGALMDIGAHIVDLLRWLSGKEVARLCASARTLEKTAGVEDNASALLEFTDGTMGSFEVSWTTRPYEVTTDFYGTRGKLHTELGAAHPVTIQYGNPNGSRLGDPSYPEIPTTSRRGGAYPYFTDCILQGKTPFISGEEGRASLEVILAVYESVRIGGWVELPLKEAAQRSGKSRDKSVELT